LLNRKIHVMVREGAPPTSLRRRPKKKDVGGLPSQTMTKEVVEAKEERDAAAPPPFRLAASQ
jgi:hypothetical protein